MFYVSSIDGHRIGVTDTRDRIEEIYRNDEVEYFITEKGLKIEGAYVYNHRAECTVINPFKKLNKTRLIELLDAWRKVHNPWTGYPVQWYLAEAEIGTTISVEYSSSDNYGHRFTGYTELYKIDSDTWRFVDSGSVDSGNTGGHSFASNCLEIACIYSKPVRISIN